MAAANKTGKFLIITEKPSVAADIAKALGGFEKKIDYYESDRYYMTWAVGHLLELLEPEDIDKKYKRWLLQDLPILPEPFSYRPKKGQSERLAQIKSLSKKADGFINACDAGREGELIFREIYEYCEQRKPFSRVWLQSMTADSIRTSFASLKDGGEYNNLGDAAYCRAHSDWLIGMNGTRAVTKRLKTKATKGVWSIGRVQTPTLALVVKRELEFLDHRPEPFFTLEGRFSTSSHEYSGLWFDPNFKKPVAEEEENHATREKEDRIFSQEKLAEILKDFEQNRARATAQETRKEAKEIAPSLFDLTLLQREANRKFAISAARTLQAAQRLYEKHKLLTYPRTDSRYLPDDYLPTAIEVIESFSGKKSPYAAVCKKIKATGLLNKERVFNSKYVSDHFAIIPTGHGVYDKLDGDDKRIFDLVLKRFLAAFMSHAVWAKVERITTVGAQHFKTRVQDLQEPGWREVYGLDSEEESKLPPLSVPPSDRPTAVKVEKVESIENATKPPPRFTEAKLLSLMEHCGQSVTDEELAQALKGKGIGTPATRSEIIENLIIKEYMVRAGKTLKASSKGIRLVDVLNRIPVDTLSKVELTGELEYELKLMEKGETKRADFMQNMFEFTTDMVERVRSFDYATLYEDESSLGVCPGCGKGKIFEGFWGYRCSENHTTKKNIDAPGCHFIIWKEKNHRYIDRRLVSDLLQSSSKVVGPYEFSNTTGTSVYEEFLTLDPQKGIVFCHPNGEVKETATNDTEILHEERIENSYFQVPAQIRVTGAAFFCEFEKDKDQKGKKAKSKRLTSRMPKVLCGREMTLDEYRSFVTLGFTPPIMDFKSKKGRIFAASLNLKDNGNFEFKFISKKSVAPTDGTAGEEKKKPAKKSTSKAKVVKKSDPAE